MGDPPSSLPPPTTPLSSPPPPPLLQVSPRRPRLPSQCLPHPRPLQPPPLPPPPPCQTARAARSSCTFSRGKFEGLAVRQEYETRRTILCSHCHIKPVSVFSNKQCTTQKPDPPLLVPSDNALGIDNRHGR